MSLETYLKYYIYNNITKTTFKKKRLKKVVGEKKGKKKLRSPMRGIEPRPRR